MVCDLRAALEQLRNTPALLQDPKHLFLILDKQTQAFPWESLPVLEGLSISRIPSIAFLHDRIDLAKERRHSPERFTSQAKKATFVLNAGGDLHKTQEEFEGWVKEKEWKGITGRMPLELEMQKALSENDLFL